jgi:hypothetical protein
LESYNEVDNSITRIRSSRAMDEIFPKQQQQRIPRTEAMLRDRKAKDAAAAEQGDKDSFILCEIS